MGLGQSNLSLFTSSPDNKGHMENWIENNKTKYFCSDSMIKYALREGLERAKKELRKR